MRHQRRNSPTTLPNIAYRPACPALPHLTTIYPFITPLEYRLRSRYHVFPNGTEHPSVAMMEIKSRERLCRRLGTPTHSTGTLFVSLHLWYHCPAVVLARSSLVCGVDKPGRHGVCWLVQSASPYPCGPKDSCLQANDRGQTLFRRIVTKLREWQQSNLRRIRPCLNGHAARARRELDLI